MSTFTPKSLERTSDDFTKHTGSGADHAVLTEKSDVEAQADPAFARKTLRKVDLYVLPILAILYSFSLIDRVNISNAYVAGMAVDLVLFIDNRYSIATLIFFIPYIILELPSNIALRHVGAARWIGTITVAWGTVMLGTGWVTKWWQLVICRALLGVLEAGFFPACTYIISTWYVRGEIQKRMTGFYVLAVMVGGFSSAIAGGIAGLAGQRGLNGWQWMFIIFGAFTVFAGIIAFFVVQDFPDKNKFLTKEQTKWVLDRIEADRADSQYDHLTASKLWSYICDIHNWSFAILFGCSTTTAYAFAYFLPIILVEGMGYSARDAQLLSAPPTVLGAAFAFAMAALGDWKRFCAPVIVFPSLVTIIGLSMTAFHTSNSVRYTGVFLGVAGGTAITPGILSYLQNNIAGQSKRAFVTAIAIGGGGIGGIVASTTFRTQDAPGFRPGLWTVIGSQLLIILICGINTAWYYHRNKQARAGIKLIEGRPGFYYTY